MGQHASNIDIQKCKLYWKCLITTFLGFVIPILLLVTQVVPVPGNGDSDVLFMSMMLAMLFSFLLYYVFLGILASKNNKSVIVWVGLGILASLIGFIVSFFLMLGVGKQNGWA
jgi:hypothetical protein